MVKQQKKKKKKKNLGNNNFLRAKNRLEKYNFLTHTCNLAPVQLKTQGDAIPPGLWPDPNEPGQNWLRDPVENHLGWVCVAVENLVEQRQTKAGY